MGYSYSSSGINKLTTGLIVYSLDTDGSPSLSIHNNIIGGKFGVESFRELAATTEDNNIFYSYEIGTTAQCEKDEDIGANDIVKTCSGDEPTSYFSDGTLFSDILSVAQRSWYSI